MKPNPREWISRCASALELIIGVLILVYCIACGLGIILNINLSAMMDAAYFQQRLSEACFIIIGIELIKMITSHTIDSVVDVMMLALARQMIIEHTTPTENLLTVLAVAVLFVVRKFLYVSQIDRRKKGAQAKPPENSLETPPAAPILEPFQPTTRV